METGTRQDAVKPGPLRERECDVALLQELARGEALYAVVDAAGKPDVYAALLAAGDHARSLYAGSAGEQYAGVAPWLVRVDTARLDWIGSALSSDPAWGVFVIARAPSDGVRRQLRRLLTVRLPEGTLVRFRFYDPRVLGPFLSACTGEELDFVLGAVDAYATVTPITQRLRVWDRPWRPALLPRPALRIPAPPVARTAEPLPAPRARALAVTAEA